MEQLNRRLEPAHTLIMYLDTHTHTPLSSIEFVLQFGAIAFVFRYQSIRRTMTNERTAEELTAPPEVPTDDTDHTIPGTQACSAFWSL